MCNSTKAERAVKKAKATTTSYRWNLWPMIAGVVWQGLPCITNCNKTIVSVVKDDPMLPDCNNESYCHFDSNQSQSGQPIARSLTPPTLCDGGVWGEEPVAETEAWESRGPGWSCILCYPLKCCAYEPHMSVSLPWYFLTCLLRNALSSSMFYVCRHNRS